MNLICSSPFRLGLFASVYFLGLIVSMVAIGPLGDIYGKSKFMWIGNLMLLPAFLIMLVSYNPNLYYVAMFAHGLSFAPKSIIALSYMFEMVPGYEGIITSVTFLLDGMQPIFATIIV